MIPNQKLIAFVTLVAIAFPIFTFGSMSEELNQFTIENDTGAELVNVFVSANDSVNYGGNLLSITGSLANKKVVEFSVHYPNRCNLFNFLAVADNAEYFSIFHYEICDGNKQHLRLGRNYFAGKKKIDSLTDIVIENGTSRSIRHLFLMPGESGVWGIDYLHGNGDVQPGQSARLRLMTPAEKLTYAVRAVSEDGETYSFAIDLDDSMREFIYEIVDDWVDAQ